MEDMAALGIDTNDYKYKELPDVVSEDKPTCIVNTKTNGQYANHYIQGVIEEDEEEEDEDDDVEADDDDDEEEEEEEKPKGKAKPKPKAKPSAKKEVEEEEEEEEEEESDDEEEEEEEEETSEPTKGMMAVYKAKGAKKATAYKVMTVNKAKKTATLASVATGTKVENVSWDDFEVDSDDE